MDKNVLNISYYDTKTKTGGNVQIQQPAGDNLLSQILEAAKPKPDAVNVVIKEPAHNPVADLIKKASAVKVQEGQHPSSRLDQISQGWSEQEFKFIAFPTYDQAKEYAETRVLPNFGKLMIEIRAEKTADEEAMEKEKTFKIKNLDKPVVVLFNGPPRSGKDSACEIIIKHFPEVHYAYFKEILYIETAKILGLDFNFWAKVCQNGDLKDISMLTMSAGETGALMTPRDILIYIAEKVLKPKHGKDFIARMTADSIIDLIKLQRVRSNEPAVVVVPDLGFDYEIDTVRKMIPDAHVISVAVYRPGFTFEGDSRNYVKDPGFGLHNTGSYEDLENKVLRLFRNIIMDIRPIPTIETM